MINSLTIFYKNQIEHLFYNKKKNFKLAIK